MDSKTGKKEEFRPHNPEQVKIYSCGPTVYNYSHIGNIRSYLFVDILRRTIKLFGFNPDQTMNITDIDDKIIRESINRKMSIEEFTKPWTEQFFEDLKTLGVEEVEHYPRATESIDEMVEMIQRLKENGLVYEKEGSVYYAIDKFGDYGELSKIDTSGMKAGARYDADEYEKDNVRDFVLWKAPKEAGEKFWETPIGKGRPGWHLECSAMIRSIYRSGVDIHTGGVDLLFPHHENEIAQSKGAYPEEDFVKYWLHCEHLLVDGQKMSKSKGNFYILKDILELGYSWKQVRYVLLSFHYRTKLNFSFERLDESKSAMDRIQNTLDRIIIAISQAKKDNGTHQGEGRTALVIPSPLQELLDGKNRTFSTEELLSLRPQAGGREFFESFMEGLSDDLNTPKALASVFDSLKTINSHMDQDSYSSNDLLDLLKFFFQIQALLGILEFSQSTNESDVDDKEMIESLIEERILAKKSKDFARADAIRDQLKSMGIQVEDTKDGSVKWKKIQ